jgi:3-oxoacyl-[acyl-carrier-protein] synthase-3
MADWPHDDATGAPVTSIVAVSSHLPETVPVAALQVELGLTDSKLRLLRRLYGIAEVCRTTEPEVDLLVAAVGKLESFADRAAQVRYVVRAKTVPTSAPYPISPLTELCAKVGLERATAFTLTEHACGSGLLAVDLCGTLLAADGDPDALALILVGEKTFTPAAQMIPDIAVLGEGVAAVLVRAGGDRDQLLGYATRTHGDPAGTTLMGAEQAAHFRRIYPNALADVVHAALAEAKLSIEDVALVLPHNVNRMSWVRASAAIGIPIDRIFLDNIGVTGHCFCADPFINYHTVAERGRLRPGEVYLMVTVGLGEIFSAMVFRH